MDTNAFKPEEGFEHYKFIASEGQEPLRVDKFLMNFIENIVTKLPKYAIKFIKIFGIEKGRLFQKILLLTLSISLIL